MRRCHREIEIVALRVPFHLLRRDEPALAVGFLLESDSPAALLAACVHFDSPLVFPVAGGFLIVADSVPAIATGIRLRRLSENCFAPADADLVPALLPAEAVDLTAKRGLVFRPNRPPLAFDPIRPMKPSAYLAIPKLRRVDWSSFPIGRSIADRLTTLTRAIPDPPIDEMLAGDGPPIGTDDARPPQTGVGRRTVGKMSTGLGKGIGALGKAIGSKTLGDLGERLKAKGAAIAPRITEDLLGRQEAALQHLLSKFRAGETEDALRRALPIGNEPGRGSQAYGGAKLPTHGLFWSLASFFGGGGPTSIWLGGNPDTWRDLIAEYHKAAREAADRGDFRRAALIYAKLLSDFRSAAAMLSKGSLHREAGILFRDKVGDLTRAAREFAQAGDHDEALRLFRESHLLVEAGDLLRQLGEEELAIIEFHRAADRVVQLRQDYVEAGDILLRKTGRADLAGAYFACGWQSRSNSQALSRNACACAQRLIEIYAFAEPRDPFWLLLDEAEDWLREPGWSQDAGRFFNKTAGLADLPHLQNDRAEIRDRCRLGLASKLHEHAKAEHTGGTIVSDLFGIEKRWSPALVSDADFALRAAMKRRPMREKLVRRLVNTQLLHAGTVTAAVQTPGNGDLFVGFQDGSLIWYNAHDGEARTIYSQADNHAVIGIATEPAGLWVASIRGERSSERRTDESAGRTYPLDLWKRGGRDFHIQSSTHCLFTAGSVNGLLPLFDQGPSIWEVGVRLVDGVAWYFLPTLIPRTETGPSQPPPTTYLKLRIPAVGGHESAFTFQGGSVSWGGKKVYIGWMPEPVAGSTLFAPPMSWLVDSPGNVQLAGLFDNGHLYSSHLTRQSDGSLSNRTLAFAASGGSRAVAIWQSGKVIGVTAANRVLWLRVSGPRLEEWSPPTELPVPARAVACFPSRQTFELFVILEDGTLARVPVPV
jgi:tetratricopeptide (TPR) repeat protein